jgi:hypothetical protein
MAELIWLVLHDTSRESEILDAWLKLGVPGITVFDSYGVPRRQDYEADHYEDIRVASVFHLLRPRQDHGHVLFSVLPDGIDMEALVATTEALVGDFDAPNTGIIFTVPVGKMWGVHR